MEFTSEKEDIIRPSTLRKGDTVGIAAPAGCFDRETFDAGVNILKSMGLSVLVPEEIYSRDGYLAGEDIRRAAILNRLFGDTRIKGIICARGGFGSMRILELLDTSLIKRNPKIFIGFSDITAILNVLVNKCNLSVLHGPTVTTLGTSDEHTLRSFSDALFSERPPEIKPAEPLALVAGNATGKVAGGNLATLCHLVGTPFSPLFGGRIVFLEDLNEAPYRIDRMLTQMKLAGCFEEVKGIMLGKFSNCGSREFLCDLFLRTFQDLNIPILAGFEIGHCKKNLVLPLGPLATLDSEAGCVTFLHASTAGRE